MVLGVPEVLASQLLEAPEALDYLQVILGLLPVLGRLMALENLVDPARPANFLGLLEGLENLVVLERLLALEHPERPVVQRPVVLVVLASLKRLDFLAALWDRLPVVLEDPELLVVLDCPEVQHLQQVSTSDHQISTTYLSVDHNL